jgi:hypothetical protein
MKIIILALVIAVPFSANALEPQSQPQGYKLGPAAECTLGHPDYNVCVRNRNFLENSIQSRIDPNNTEPASGEIKVRSGQQIQPQPNDLRNRSASGYAPAGTTANPAQR